MSTNWLQILRHGTEPTLLELENYTFESVVFDDGTILENVTFAQLQAQVWAELSRSADPTWAENSRNAAMFANQSRSADPSWAEQSKNSANWAEQTRN